MTDVFYGTSGPRDAKIVLVGESWGSEEAAQKVPFVGQSGKEQDRMLLEAGIDPASVFKTNVFGAQPKGNDAWHFFHPKAPKSLASFRGLDPTQFALEELARLYRQLAVISPKVVIAAGNYALWALSPQSVSISHQSLGNGATVRVPGGIASWRGSMLESSLSELGNPSPSPAPLRVLPIIHPAAIMRAWYQRAVTVHDLRRTAQALNDDWRPAEPPVIMAPPRFDLAEHIFEIWLRQMDSGTPLRLAHDIETSRALITCMGFATGGYDAGGTAMVIPFVRLLPQRQFESFWPPQQEVRLVSLIRKVLTHPNVLIEGQNYIYDTQYVEHFLGVRPNLDFDSMLAQHLLFPGTPKGLDYLSSLYCRYHWYWKDDNKEWDLRESEKEHLEYNAVDVLRTYECCTALRGLIARMGQSEQWEWEKRKHGLALRMMTRGIKIDTKRRHDMGNELLFANEAIFARVSKMIPRELVPQMKTKNAKPWWRSAIQQRGLFYDVLGLKGHTNRKTGNATVNEEALVELSARYPELKRLFGLLLESRSIGVFYSTFVNAGLEPNGRMKCSFNPAGTETFRWSSSSNAFGRGTNLQNVPQGDED